MIMDIIQIFVVLIAYLSFIQVYRQYTKDKSMEFEIKMEAAKSSGISHINTMSYKDLLSIVDSNIAYYVNDAMLSSGLVSAKSDEERSIQFNDIHVSIASKVEMSLSDSVKKAILNYVSQEHLRIYIKDTTRILLIAKTEQSISNIR